MATKDIPDDSDTQNKVIIHHLDNYPEGSVDYMQSDMVPKESTTFCSYHDSDSDLPDYELRSMSSFLGVDLDKSADSWDWTFHDENVSDLDIKTIPERVKTGKILANINEDLLRDGVESELETMNSQLQDDPMKSLKSRWDDERKTEQYNNIESTKTYCLKDSLEIGTHEDESTTSLLQKEEKEQFKTMNYHRQRVHKSTSSSFSKDYSTPDIQRNASTTDIATMDDFIYFKDSKSKLLKIRLQYLSNNCNVGKKHRQVCANKLERTNINKILHHLKFTPRSSETTEFETQNITPKLTKLNNTEARFMYSSCNAANIGHFSTMPSQKKQLTSILSLSKSKSFLPPLNGKRFRSFFNKRNSSNDLLAGRITSWRLNGGWAMSKQDLLLKRPTKEDDLGVDNVSFVGSSGRHSWDGNVGLHKFRHVARMILILLKAVGRRREKRDETNYNFLSWTVVYDEVLGISRLNYDSGSLSFDPLLFKANRESTLSQDIKDILRLPPEQRTEAHIRTVMISFHNVVPSFSEYPKEIQQSMIKVCMYEKFEPGRVIIRQGHRAENFYFIIGGCAVVTQMDSDAGHVHTTNVLGKGNSFGELAFLHMSKRSATVTCRDDVELLCIEREDFIDIFMRPRKGDEPDHIKFLKSVDILQGWPVSLLPHVNPKICAFTFVRRGVILCQDNASSDWIFVVYSGSCKVFKALEDVPLPGLEGKTHPTGAHKVNLAPHSNISKVGKTTTSTGNGEKAHMNGHNQPGSFKRLRKYGVSLPPIRSTVDRNLGQKMDASVSHMDHLDKINNIFYRKHVLPTILRNNQAEQENNQEPHARTVSSETSILPKIDPTFKFKRQSYGGQPPALPQIVVHSAQTATTQQQPLRKIAFVEIARLEPGDIFGLEHVVLSGIRNVASCSLVSQGAEVVLISKSFFKKHLTEDTVKRMRQLIQPLPSEKALQKKFLKKKQWDIYKSQTVARHALQARLHGAAPQS